MRTQDARWTSAGRQKRADGHPDPGGAHQEGPVKRGRIPAASLEAARCATAVQLAHEAAEIERRSRAPANV